MNENQSKVTSYVIMQLEKKNKVTIEEIKKFVDFFSQVNPLSEDEKKEVIQEVQAKIQIKIDKGILITEKNHKPWYLNAKGEINPLFWERYRSYLQSQGWATSVINEMDDATDSIMDLLGNPSQQAGFKRLGLCIGEVQSGKTANYIALINKAADAGYKIIILLTGIMEKLRSQTQERIDLGFTGLDSDAYVNNNNADQYKVGVGNLDTSVTAWSLTTKSKDFRRSTASSIIPRIEDITVPVIFVLKKNSSVLKNLSNWFKLISKGKINFPMLLIDDEADNASINTNNPDNNPTAINKAIRELLDKFAKSNYVGFTATPYANIFIDPDTDDEMLKGDLFPKDFIYCLASPSNYIGPESVFGLEGSNRHMLCNNDDCEEYVPMKHKKDFYPGPIPASLETALCSFFIINTIRDLRGDKTKHRTMMINVSRFINVQKKIRRQVADRVKEYQNVISNYYLCGDDALVYPEFKKLKSVYNNKFSHCCLKDGKTLITWEDIQKNLKNAIMPIQVEAVNGGNAVEILNYDKYSDTGLRLIAIGGQSLSRGLTLEGLCVSYFHRNSKMYDTLMQMGRWFGYRPGYDDLCQIWMPIEAIDWYQQITEATIELKEKIQIMQNNDLTPENFGLCVRQDENALLVTARNKMKTAQSYTRTINLSGEVIETPYLFPNKRINERNDEVTKEFIQVLLKNYKRADNPELAVHDQIQFLNIEATYVSDYLKEFECHFANQAFQTKDILEALFGEHPIFKCWDVVIASGKSQQSVEIGNLTFKPVVRGFRYNKTVKALQLGGEGSRLGSKGMSKAGLTKKQVEEIEEKFGKTNGKTYFRSDIKRNPLLIIYPVELSLPRNEQNVDKETQHYQDLYENHVLVGLAIGIPNTNGESIKHVYKMNIVMQRAVLGADEEDNTDDFDEDVI
ncbi:MAG: Z1 domain-containing protein [Acidaminococcus sp.]|uniref:Z1 domain-containing protein n=1 Tax=Acidaminococcus sp. TaxID=1872103 RepID=UPI003F177E18